MGRGKIVVPSGAEKFVDRTPVAPKSKDEIMLSVFRKNNKSI